MVVLGQTGVKAETERHRGKDVWTDRSCSVVSHPEIDSPFFPLVGLPGQFLPFFTAPFLQLQVAALLGDQGVQDQLLVLSITDMITRTAPWG